MPGLPGCPLRELELGNTTVVQEVEEWAAFVANHPFPPQDEITSRILQMVSDEQLPTDLREVCFNWLPWFGEQQYECIKTIYENLFDKARVQEMGRRA